MTRTIAAVVLLAAAAIAARPSLSPGARLAELRAILASKNDNDPRLDRDFAALSPEAKKLFVREYFRLAPEKRNERGTIVYLLGKNLTTAADWRFMRAVAAEPPCLSLSDCKKPSAGPVEPGDAVTLAYPSLVALKQAERALQADPASAPARAVLEAGARSQSPAVARLARKIAVTIRTPSRR